MKVRCSSVLELQCTGGLLAESDIRDLGGHSEVIVDSFMNLYCAGKPTNKKKGVDKGLTVYGSSRQ